ncbi:RNA-dependent RNA polymerase, partial [Phenoliferia sp. Uapishka_3]
MSLSSAGRGTERDTLFDGGYEADGVARGDARGFKGVTCLGEPSALRLGRWLSYRFSLPESDLPRLKAALKSLDLVRSFRPLKQSLSTNYHFSSVALLSRLFPVSLPFPVRYAIDGLLSFGIIIDAQVVELLDLLKEFGEDADRKERILNSFFRSTRIWDLKKSVEEVKPFILGRPKRPPQSHMVFVAKAVVTPTRVLLYPPECQTSNAVLRAFPIQAEEGRFIRVQFWDEGDRLNMNYEVKGDNQDMQEGIIARFRRCLEHGLEFGGRKYVALDYSASQARTNAFWAICEDYSVGFTRKKVRALLGDYSGEKIVAKHAARRGQLYSTTRDIGVVDKIGRIPDYETEEDEEGGRYTFSDGVGICTQQIATRAAAILGLDPAVAERTSACQIRHGGRKGMLVRFSSCLLFFSVLTPVFFSKAVWPPEPKDSNGDPLFPDVDWPEVGPEFDVLVRPSLEKFTSLMDNLGVVRVSVYSHAYLNREVLMLLFPRGIRHTDITKRFEDQVSEILGTESSLAAGKPFQPYHLRLFASSKVPVRDLVDAGFHQEPFVRSLARLFANRALWDLKWKARIFVEKGVNLLGVVDELGTLEEGQIYCRTIDREGKEHTVTGRCIIFRAPTRHPGDVQVVEAVNNPALEAAGLTNVIIFNRMGDRDLPSMLGGGDLDGDDYTLLWDEHFTSIREHEPMEYTPAVEPARVDEVTSGDIRKFHITYMKEDTLGAISNSHLALADQLGPEHSDCLDLCELHSTAVDCKLRTPQLPYDSLQLIDFVILHSVAKTGVPAVLPQDLRPSQWPDFMGPRLHSNVYESKSPLGHMFRHPSLNPFPPLEPVQQIFLDPRLAKIPIKVSIMENARRLKGAYDMEVSSLMLQFQAEEVSVVAGVVLELPGGLRRMEKDSKLRIILEFEKSMRAHERAVKKDDEAPRKKTLEALGKTLGKATDLAAAEVAKNGGDILSDEMKKLLDDITKFQQRAIDSAYGNSSEWDLGGDQYQEGLCDFLTPYTEPLVVSPLGGNARMVAGLAPLLEMLMRGSGRGVDDFNAAASSAPGGSMFTLAPAYDPSSRPSPYTTPVAKFFHTDPATPPRSTPVFARSILEARCEVTSERICTPGQIPRFTYQGLYLCRRRLQRPRSYSPCLSQLLAVHTMASSEYEGALAFLQGGKKLVKASSDKGKVGVWELEGLQTHGEDGKKRVGGKMRGEIDTMRDTDGDEDAIELSNGAPTTSVVTLDNSFEGISLWAPLVGSDNFICTSSGREGNLVETFELDWTTGKKTMRYFGHGGKVTGFSTAEGRENDFLTTCSDGATRLFDRQVDSHCWFTLFALTLCIFTRRTPKPSITFAVKDAEEMVFAIVFAGGTKTEQISAFDARVPGTALYSLATGNNAVQAIAWQTSTNSLWAATECSYMDRMGGHHDYRKAKRSKAERPSTQVNMDLDSDEEEYSDKDDEYDDEFDDKDDDGEYNWPEKAFHDEQSFGYTFDSASHQLFRYAFKDKADPKVLPRWGESYIGHDLYY